MSKHDQPADEGAIIPTPDETKIMPSQRNASRPAVATGGQFHDVTPLGDGASDLPPTQPDRVKAEPFMPVDASQLLSNVQIPTYQRAQYSMLRANDVSRGGTHSLAGAPLGTPIGEGLTSDEPPKPRLRAAEKPPAPVVATGEVRLESEPTEYFAPPTKPMSPADVEYLAKAEAADAVRRNSGHFPVPTTESANFSFSDRPRNQPGYKGGRERE